MNKQKLERVTYGLNGGLFLLAGSTLLMGQQYWFAVLQLLAAGINFSLLWPRLAMRSKRNLNYAVLLMNVVVAVATAIDYHLTGKQYIQYVWLLAAFFSVVAFILIYKRTSTAVR